jgi:hypothetical protein
MPISVRWWASARAGPLTCTATENARQRARMRAVNEPLSSSQAR